MNRLEEYYGEYFECPNFVSFMNDHEGDPNYLSDYFRENEATPFIKDLRYEISYYDSSDNYIKYLVIHFEGILYRLTLHFNSYSAEFDYERVKWDDFKVVKPFKKEVIFYE